MRRLLFFHAHWCMPCKYVARTLIEEIEKDCPDQVTRVDIDDDTDNWCKKLRISRVPRVILMDDNNVVGAYTGIYPPHGKIVDWLKGGELQ